MVMEVQVERAVPGGRMLARHEGVVVLVAGAVPGERVRVHVERRTKSVIFARVTDVIDASPFRRIPVTDPLCGGMDYAHIAYDAQLRYKRDIITDALHRIGHLNVQEPIEVSGSPEEGYRLRARLHVSGGRAGFFLEGSHSLCDAAATGQLRPDTVPVVERVMAALGGAVRQVAAVVVAENIAGSQRVLHLEGADGAPVAVTGAPEWLERGLTGVSAAGPHGKVVGLVGAAHVVDTAAEMFGENSPVPVGTTWVRQAASFFQGNRFLVGELTRAVCAAADGGQVADLYAGVGLFAVALAARGHHVVAVEGDRPSGRDLATNAEPYGGRLRPVRSSVEDAFRQIGRERFDTIVLDPPRSGVSPPALTAVISLRAARVLYVSCDPATLARDSARLVASGYTLSAIRAFDLFPNTAHVETLAIFDRKGS
jgi:23S rRNA (uracil1939-C5)-methyltransferase